MTESLLLGSMLTDGGFAHHIIVGASSHFCTAERQFRMPVEHGNQRPPTAQWTATAAGAMIVSESERKKVRNIRVDCGTIGKVIDAGVKDANQMGSAMAPAAVDTILNHLDDTGRNLDDYDMIITGDLGVIGKKILENLLLDNKVDIRKRHMDCGIEIFNRSEQDTHSGGSGCACSAVVLAAWITKKLEEGEWKRILFVPTGAMFSPTSFNEGQPVPGIAHAVWLEREE